MMNECAKRVLTGLGANLKLLDWWACRIRL